MRRLLLVLCLLAHFAAAQPLPGRAFLKQFGPAEGLPQPFIYALIQDRAGYLWLGTAEGLIRFDGTEFITFTTREGLAEDFVTRLVLDPRTGWLWVGHFQGRLSRWNGQRFQTVAPNEATGSPLRPVAGIVPPDTAFREPGQPPLLREAPGVGPTFGLGRVLPAGTVVQCVLPDREGNLWIGTAGQGLWRWADRHVLFYPRDTTAGRPRISALLTEKLVFAGLNTGQWAALRPSPSLAASLQIFPGRLLPYAPNVLLATPDKRAAPGLGNRYRPQLPATIWAGTAGYGLWQAAMPSAVSEQLPMRLVRRLPATVAITALTQHRNGDLWVGTALDGAYRLPADSTQPAEHFTTANGLLHNTIHALTTDSAGQVWVGTHGTGLAVWRRGQFRYYRYSRGMLNVSALLTDQAGRVWIGTEGQGVLSFRDDKFTYYTSTQGLGSQFCYALLPVRWDSSRHDAQQQVAAIHRDGVSLLGTNGLLRPMTLPVNPLVRDLLPQATVAWSGYVLWLRTRTGLLRVRADEPALLPGTIAPIPTLLASVVDGAAHQPQHLRQLPAGQHRVAFRFRSVSLRPGATELQYQYRLQGYQEDWSTPAATAEAQFPRLEAGRFTFEVRTRLGQHGRWSAPATASFSIATPFWQSPWFALLSLAVGLGSIWGFLRFRTATLRSQKLQLETTVQVRTAELRREKEATEQVNADLLVARDAAEASQRAKAQFLANMSHEIRTPLNAVIGLTHLLRGTRIDAGQQHYLEAIQSSSQNLLVILNDILDSSKMEAGKLTLEQLPFRLAEFLERVQATFRFAVEAKGLYLRTEIAPETPAAVTGDPVRLQQVLVNLVGNALKFTAHGGITLLLQASPIAGGAGGLMLRFGVRDTGIGIAAAQQEAIFEDFAQANASTTRQFGGTGLGLSIARNLVRLHGGRLWVESTEGRGSTFWFDIPTTPADLAAIPPEATTSLPAFETPLRVLVAEDNLLNQLVVRRTLEAWNVLVTVADNGRLAVEAARQQPFDAVLLDVQMPEMDGYEAARQLRQLFPDPDRLPLIGLTASALPEDRVLALAAGMNDTLAKPFDPAVLYARLAHYTGRTALVATTPTRSETAQMKSSYSTELTELTEALVEQPDWSLLEELAGGNSAFVGQLIRTFLAQAPPLAQQLGQLEGLVLAEAAHKLRGQVGYFGLPQLCQLLELVEETAPQLPSTPALPGLLADIQHRLRALSAALEQRLAAG